MKRLILLLLLALLTLQAAIAQDDVLRVDASESLGTISPYLHGANMGHNSLVPPSLMPQAQALELNYIRFGGGISDQRDLTKPMIDLFVYVVRQIGAEPAMTVRLLDGTPEEAAEMVAYANVEKGYGIRYWSIGNEPNLFESLLGAEGFNTNELNTQWRAIAEAMLEVDPDILLVGPDITQYVPLSVEGDTIEYLPNSSGGHPFDSEGNDWLQSFLEANGDLVDIVSIHRYPYPGISTTEDPNATVEGLRENSREWDVIIPNLRQIIQNAAGRDIPIAITEFNSNSSGSMGGEASLDSHYNALWIGDVLGRLINNQVEIASVWDIQSTNGFGLFSRDSMRPSYYTYLMYSKFGTELLAAESSDPNVSVYAAQREDGTLTVIVINLGDDEQTRTLVLEGFTPGGDAEVWRFDATINAEQIEAQAVGEGASLTLPGRSMTLYVIPG